MEKYVEFQLGKPVSHYSIAAPQQVFPSVGVTDRNGLLTAWDRALVRQVLMKVRGPRQGTGKKQEDREQQGSGRGLSFLSPIIHFFLATPFLFLLPFSFPFNVRVASLAVISGRHFPSPLLPPFPQNCLLRYQLVPEVT